MASSSEDADAPLLILKLSERAPPLVRDVFEEKGFREHEEGVDGEHHWHLHWKAGRFKPSEYEVASKLQRVNHFPKTTGITKKDCLLRNMRRMRGIHGPIYDFFPEAYLLPTEYMTMVRVCKELAGRGVKPIWILKPTDASQGRKIFLIRDLAEISYGHFSSSIAAAAADLRGEGGGDDDGDGGGGEERERAIATEIDMATTLRMLRSRLKQALSSPWASEAVTGAPPVRLQIRAGDAGASDESCASLDTRVAAALPRAAPIAHACCFGRARQIGAA